LRITNIHNINRETYLFCRKEDGTQEIIKDNSFFPFYYEYDAQGKYRGYDGTPLKKVIVSNPSDVRKNRSLGSFGSDISFKKLYLTHKVKEIEKAPVRFMFIDIEIQTKELPDIRQAKAPITCISVYDSFNKTVETFWIKDYDSEETLINEFIHYVKLCSPDLLCLTPDTIVKTPNGFTKLSNLKIGDTVLSVNKENKFSEAKIINLFKSKKELLKFTTKKDTITSSKDHLFPVFNENEFKITNSYQATSLKKAKDIKEGDFFLNPINYLHDDGKRSDFHWLMGYYFADGTKGINKRLEIKDENKELLEEAQKIFKELGIESKIRLSKTCYLLYSEQSFKALALKNKITENYNNLPTYLNSLSVGEQISLISGFIDGDGRANSSMSVGTINEYLIDWISYVLWGLGIPNKKRTDFPRKETNEKPFHSVNIERTSFNSIFYLKHPKKKKYLTLTDKCCNNTVPFIKVLQKLVGTWKIQLPSYLKKEFWKNDYQINKKAALHILNFLLSCNLKHSNKHFVLKLINLLENFYFSKIEEIEEISEGDTIEISLDKHFLFIANNILTHNCGWNVSFDYNYLHNRIKNFAKRISPINQDRFAPEEYKYPAGISILDYMSLFKKVFMREASYALNNISQKYLNDDDWGETDFSQVTDDIKEKNINDVKRLVKLEEKFNLLGYFDEIRRLTKVQWEDLYHNSAIIESLLFEEAKKMNIVLPNKQEKVENTSFQGATRESSKTGALFNIGKYDLESAYPSMIINFCLDFQNIVTAKDTMTPSDLKNVVDIDGILFKQNPNTLVPNMVRKILTLKNNLKKELAEHPSEELKLKYNAIKAVANSAFGAFGNQYFRLYDNRITSSITYLVRDLLMYTKDELEKKSIETVYWDTDSIFADTTVNILPMLNETIQKWGKEKYNKDSIALKYDYEGYFEKLFLLAKCRYIGYLNKKGKGKIEQEVKGVEVKRVSSAKFEGQFQEKLIDMILDKKSREEVEDFILEQKKALKKAPLEDIAFPIKLSSIVYKGNPIQKRCLDNSRIVFKDMKIGVGEVFYYIFVKGYGYDKSNKEINVLAFKKGQNIIPREKVDFEEMTRRNIDAKISTIYEAMGWSIQSDERQGRLF